jgi:hypothetical protein
LNKIKSWAAALKRDLLALWVAAGCQRTPVFAKLIAGAVALYAFSPDFIPVLGLLDDLILVPIGIAICLMLIPAPLIARFRLIGARMFKQRPKSMFGLVMILALWIAGGYLALRMFSAAWQKNP